MVDPKYVDGVTYVLPMCYLKTKST